MLGCVRSTSLKGRQTMATQEWMYVSGDSCRDIVPAHENTNAVAMSLTGRHCVMEHCPCHSLWRADRAHSLGKNKSMLEVHGYGCRFKYCWRILTGLCDWREGEYMHGAFLACSAACDWSVVARDDVGVGFARAWAGVRFFLIVFIGLASGHWTSVSEEATDRKYCICKEPPPLCCMRML